MKHKKSEKFLMPAKTTSRFINELATKSPILLRISLQPRQSDKLLVQLTFKDDFTENIMLD